MRDLSTAVSNTSFCTKKKNSERVRSRKNKCLNGIAYIFYAQKTCMLISCWNLKNHTSWSLYRLLPDLAGLGEAEVKRMELENLWTVMDPERARSDPTKGYSERIKLNSSYSLQPNCIFVLKMKEKVSSFVLHLCWPFFLIVIEKRSTVIQMCR